MPEGGVKRVPCSSTVHCANWGFCHRCMPNMAELQGFLLGNARMELLYSGDRLAEAQRDICRALSIIAITMKQDIPFTRLECSKPE